MRLKYSDFFDKGINLEFKDNILIFDDGFQTLELECDFNELYTEFVIRGTLDEFIKTYDYDVKRYYLEKNIIMLNKYFVKRFEFAPSRFRVYDKRFGLIECTGVSWINGYVRFGAIGYGYYRRLKNYNIIYKSTNHLDRNGREIYNKFFIMFVHNNEFYHGKVVEKTRENFVVEYENGVIPLSELHSEFIEIKGYYYDNIVYTKGLFD